MFAKQGNSPRRWRQHVSPKYNIKTQKTFIWCLISPGLSNCRPRSHTWPMCWYLWVTNNKLKCQFCMRLLHVVCDVCNRLWNPTVMRKNLTVWHLRQPSPFGVKNSRFPSAMELVTTFKTDSKILSCHCHRVLTQLQLTNISISICHQPLHKNNETTCSHFFLQLYCAFLILSSLIYPTNAQLDCSKRMLKFTLIFTWKMFLPVSV